MVTVSVHEAKTHLSSILSDLERFGEKVVICRHGHAIAELSPIVYRKRTDVDTELAEIEINCDLTESTEEEWDEI